MRRSRFHAGLLAAYLLLTCILSYPLITHLTTHVPGSDLWAFDEYTFVWDIWWFKHALLVLQQSPLTNNYIFYPLGINLALFTLTVFNGALAHAAAAVASAAIGQQPDHAVRLRRVGLRHVPVGRGPAAQTRGKSRSDRAIDIAAVVAGTVWRVRDQQVCPPTPRIGHYNVVGTEWVPFYVLYLGRCLRRPSRRSAVMAGVFLALALYVEMFVVVFLGAVSLLYLCVRQPWRVLGWR